MSNNREIIANEIVSRFVSSISGTDKDQVVFFSPDERIYVGKLSPQSSSNDFSSSVSIKQISTSFRVPKDDIDMVVLEIKPQGYFFYRVIPTLEQQREYFVKDLCDTFEGEFNFSSFDTFLEAYQRGDLPAEACNHKVKLLPVYEKTCICEEDISLSIKLSEIYNKQYECGSIPDSHPFNQMVGAEVEKLSDKILSNPSSVPCQFRDKIHFCDIDSEDSWQQYIQKQISREEIGFLPKFNYSVSVDLKGYNDFIDITIALSNETMFGDETSGYGLEEGKTDKYRINTLFNSGLHIKCVNSRFVPIELDYFADDYKYDKNVFALGNNCNVDYDIAKMEIQTVHVPVFIQKRLKTNDRLSVKFDSLIADPVKTLRFIHQKMLDELEMWKNDLDNRKDLTDSGKRQFETEISAFSLEIKRFRTGIEIIEKYNMIRESFVLMNLSFKKSSKGYDSWRLFQIVFIVSLLLDVVANEPELMLDDDLKSKAKTDDVDILYFPTGGGKTEAFLGILVFNLFFDRLRGKEYGVTAMLKYPLRLLSVQQVQRVSNILATAEIIRLENNIGGATFSLGYFVGDGNTPNKIDSDLKRTLEEFSSEQIDEKYKLLDVCPFCGNKSIHVIYDSSSNSLVHTCASADCPSKGVIPLYMVDDDIYRYLPSVIISTVDKMTAIGFNTRFHNLLCGAHYKCPKHGFSDRRKCLVDGCSCDPFEFEHISMKDPAPSLLIQDELHLIKESLGAYDSHYETLIEYFVKNLSGSDRGIKVIGATATISAYETQAKHLYWKNAIRFPTASPYLTRNFYSQIDENDIGRIILGYAPFGKAIVNSVAYSMQYLKRVVYNLYKHPEQILELDGFYVEGSYEERINQAQKLLEDYWIILEYNNVKLESNRVLQALEDPINTELIAEDIQPLQAKKMTGDDSFQEVRATLSTIENAKNITDGIDFNMIAATSMISHGVDADRFNLMLFYGMPGNTAEYIQAYSRVGRKYTGIVIDIMRPSREKDQSYLKHFNKFHEFKDILVDSVSINRWAAKAVENTLPGIVSSLFLNYYLYKLQFSQGTEDISKYGCLKKAINDGKITLGEVKEHVYGIYKCSDQDSSVGKLYKEKVDVMLDEIFDRLSNSSFDSKDYLTKVFDRMYFHVMKSLRDTDNQIIVEMK